MNPLLLILGRPTLLAIALLMLAAVMAGCATTMGYVPDELLTCEPAPKSPADDPNATEEDGALYVPALAAAGEDCRSTLGDVREILRPETKK